MPFAIVNRIIEEFNTNGISSVLRADNILDYQLSSPQDTFGLTNYQKTSLEQNNILPLDYEGGGIVLAYETANRGSWNIVHGTVPSSPSISKIMSAYKSKYQDKTFTSMNLVAIEEAMNDGSFKNPYTTASKTWRGGNSGWYDTLTSLNEAVRGLQRSRFFFGGVSRTNRITRLAARSIMKGRNISTIYSGDGIQDEDGGINTTPSLEDSGFNKSALKAASIVNSVSKLANGVCAYVEVTNRVQTIIKSVATLQQMNLVSGFTESVQMVQAGDDSEGVAMHEYVNNLVMNDESGKNAIESAGLGAMFNGSAIDPNNKSVKTATSEGAFAHLSESSNPISIALAQALDGTTNFLNAMTTCTYIKGTVSIISSIITIASIATAGAAKLVEFAIRLVVAAGTAIAIDLFMGMLIDWFWDNYGKVLEKDLATAVFGEDLGNALMSGANKYLSSNHQIGGGSPATRNQIIAFRRQQEIVLAEEAEYQRSIRSPFDITSQYTFLGSIVYDLIPMANTSGVGAILKNINSIMTNSINTLLPSASAIAETKLISSFGNCPTLESIGIVGDAYCNPYFISDTSTNTSVAMRKKLGEYSSVATNNDYYWKSTGNDTYLNPDEIIKILYNNLKVLESETPVEVDHKGEKIKTYKIKENSNLSKHIQFCDPRTADWGFADPNIAEQLSKNRNNNWWNKLPFIGDLISAVNDMIEAKKDKDWISGYNCVARDYDPSCDSYSDDMKCYWQNEGRYYQRFIEDQRFIISAGTKKIDADPATVTLAQHYEENPLDQTFEGILARYSGMSKDDVIATLDLIEGLNYLANYHPEDRLAFGINETDQKIHINEETDEFEEIVTIEPKYIIYDTLRNKVTIS